MTRPDTPRRASIRATVVLASLGLFAATVDAAPDLVPGTYRCSAYNVSGGAGSCRNIPSLDLGADGSYRYSSTRGSWSTDGGVLFLSASPLWGPGEILGSDTVRFAYDYRDWRHVVTWTCQACASTRRPDRPATGSYAGVSLTLQFGQPIGGVSGFAIVPAESARAYGHNAPLPQGAVQGVAWETSPTAVAVASNRNNRLLSGRRYVIFLAWPRETVAVAVMDLPPMDGDYTATLAATLDSAGVWAGLRAGSASAATPSGHSATPPPPPSALPAEDAGVPAAPSDSRSDRQGFVNAAPTQQDGKERDVDPPTASPPHPPVAPVPSASRCNPQVPKYSQPGCIE